MASFDWWLAASGCGHMAELVKGPCLAASVNLPKCPWLGATISHSASSKIVKAGTASWRSYLNQCGPLPILGRIRASLQKINSYSCLPDDLYGLQPLNLTPHLLWKYFLRLHILSQWSVSNVKLIICTDLRNCVSVCPLPSVKP